MYIACCHAMSSSRSAHIIFDFCFLSLSCTQKTILVSHFAFACLFGSVHILNTHELWIDGEKKHSLLFLCHRSDGRI